MSTWTSRWTSTWTSFASARTGHTATLLGNGKVLIVGEGAHSYPGAVGLATAELYDSSMGTFAATGSMATTRILHTATLVPSGKVFIAGGGAQTNAESFDPGTGTFTTPVWIPDNLELQAATLLPNGKVLIAGGYGGGGGGGTWNVAMLYDPDAGTATAIGNMTVARYQHTATLLPNGKVLIAGGNGGLSFQHGDVRPSDP